MFEKKHKYSVFDIVKWFFNENRKRMNFEDSEYITNLKLQKLLYYAQGYNLARRDNVLFNDDFFAWEHGPVIKKVYDRYKVNGSKGIEYDENFNINVDEETEKILYEVYNEYGQYSAWKLRNMTHEEDPWKTTPRNQIITKEKIKQYFKERIA